MTVFTPTSRRKPLLSFGARLGVIPSLVALVLVPPTWADGGHIALHATSGAYTVTLFTAPNPLVTGACDLSLLVQDAATEEVAGTATAEGSLQSGAGEAVAFQLARTGAGKPLLAASPVLRAAGSYRLNLRVARPGLPPATFATVLAVGQNHGRRSTLLFALLLPVAAILLFMVNQQAKHGALLRRQQPAAWLDTEAPARPRVEQP